ncbi:hypothetical protein J2W34_003047 [Variovorax boronicumulans]|nr:hypothetical protein [Variovorax boronicumulans]
MPHIDALLLVPGGGGGGCAWKAVNSADTTQSISNRQVPQVPRHPSPTAFQGQDRFFQIATEKIAIKIRCMRSIQGLAGRKRPANAFRTDIKKAPTSGAFQVRAGISYGCLEGFFFLKGKLSPRTLGSTSRARSRVRRLYVLHRTSALGITRFALLRTADSQTKVFPGVNDVARLMHVAPHLTTRRSATPWPWSRKPPSTRPTPPG